MSGLYGIVVVDTKVSNRSDFARGSIGGETGMTFFSDQQIDRSPCAESVAAPVTVIYARGVRKERQQWTYHSLISDAFGGFGGKNAFVAESIHKPNPEDEERGRGSKSKTVRMRIDGHTNHTGIHTFVQEEGHEIGSKGFSMFQGSRFLPVPLPGGNKECFL